jgi:hypothetical protein
MDGIRTTLQEIDNSNQDREARTVSRLLNKVRVISAITTVLLKLDWWPWLTTDWWRTVVMQTITFSLFFWQKEMSLVLTCFLTQTSREIPPGSCNVNGLWFNVNQRSLGIDRVDVSCYWCSSAIHRIISTFIILARHL